MSKHTPGPWTNDITVPLKAWDCEQLGFSIVFVNGHREGESKANANLIAAAPTMLEALKACLDTIEHLSHSWTGEGIHPHESATLARAAIAKATNE